MASHGPARKDSSSRTAAAQPPHLFFRVGDRAYLLAQRFDPPAWGKLNAAHVAAALPILRRAAGENITFAPRLRSTFAHDIAPLGQHGYPADAVGAVGRLIERQRLHLFLLGEAAPHPSPDVRALRIDVVPVRPQSVAPGDAAAAAGDTAAPTDLGERFVIVLEGIREIPVRDLGEEAGELVAALAVSGAVLRIAALLAAWIASHFTPVGWLIDIGMIGYGTWMVGVGFADVLKRLIEIARAIRTARTRAELKAQSFPLAKLFIEAGVTALLAFFLKGVNKRKAGGGGGSEVPELPMGASQRKLPPVPGKVSASARPVEHTTNVATPMRDVRPDGIPGDWQSRPTRGEGGVQYFNPKNPNENVRVMPGNPDSPFPNSQVPYVRQQNAAGTYLRQDGTPSNLSRGGLRDPDAHIPLSKFRFTEK